MPISNVNLGQNSATASTTNAITTVANVGPGDLILVVVGYANISDTLTGVTDSSGNTYVILENITGTGIGIGVAYSQNSLTMLTGGTITCTFAGAVNSQARAVDIDGLLGGIQRIGALDTSNNSAQGLAATAATNVATPALQSAQEILIGILATATGSGNVTPGGPWNAIGGNTANSPNCRLFADNNVNSRAAVSFAPTWVNVNNYVTEVLSFIGVAAWDWIPELSRPDTLATAMVAQDATL